VEYLTTNEVLLLHARLVQLTGGSRGVRDTRLLESALARPQATFDGTELYADLWAKAAALLHSLARNHPFVDGNKRTALAATGVFLELNGYRLVSSNEEAVDLIRRVVAGQAVLEDVAVWLREHSQVQQG
jgi:death-on-curing protein